MQTTVRFQNVSKEYRLGGGQGSLREAITGLSRKVLRRNTPKRRDNEYFWALKNVSFSLEPGQILGLIGRNGAGKTTALKLLSRVAQPTTGLVEISGRISALIELGAGFHPELTGRENVYLNGVILGLSRKEIDRKFDSIVSFAELEKFIDTPVKRYSSGMYARLGFAVAAHSEPDVLLVDEVLAVGDVAFQRKCYDFLHSFVNTGKTAVFVSHHMYVLEQLCNRLVWLDHGQVLETGRPEQVLPAYLDFMDQQAVTEEAIQASGLLRLAPARFVDGNGRERDSFSTGEEIVIELPYDVDLPIERPHFSLGVATADGGPLIFSANMLVDGAAPECIVGRGVLRCRFKSVPLQPRAYHLWGEVYGADGAQLLFMWQKLGAFRIKNDASEQNDRSVKGSIRDQRAGAPVSLPYEWGHVRKLESVDVDAGDRDLTSLNARGDRH